MIKDIELGIYACEAYGGMTQLENFSFSSGYAYMIRNGKIAEMVKDVILAGNLFSTLENIDAIGNDFKWLNTGGGCGKGNQNNQEFFHVKFLQKRLLISNCLPTKYRENTGSCQIAACSNGRE
jgi:predicted Zn-dependent protease